ncbi:putative acetyltransferase EpsM [subsurface metagenome]
MKKSIILIGGGGHCKSCIDVIEQEGIYVIEGIVDLPEKKGQKILGYPIIANDSDLKDLCKEYPDFLIALGHIQSPKRRIEIFELLKNHHANLPVIVSPFAYVSKHATIEEGTVVMHHALINANAKIGKNCIINSKALIEHDAIIEDHCHISTGALINGGCLIQENCLIGGGSVLKQSINIFSRTIIGVGALVTEDITESGVYIGSPAKKMK